MSTLPKLLEILLGCWNTLALCFRPRLDGTPAMPDRRLDAACLTSAPCVHRPHACRGTLGLPFNEYEHIITILLIQSPKGATCRQVLQELVRQNGFLEPVHAVLLLIR